MPTEAKSQPVERTDRVGDLDIHVLEEGNGEALVFLHGWSVHAGSTRDLRELLRDRFRVIVPTLVGFGKSSPLPYPTFNLNDFGETIAAWLRQSGLTDVTLIGHSLGGAISLATAARAAKLKRLILIDSLGVPIRRSGREWAQQWLKKRLGNWQRSPLRTIRNLDAALLTHALLRPQDLTRLAQLAQTLDARPFASAIRVPTTILWGDRDEYIPRPVGEELQRLIPASSFHVVPGDHDWPLLQPEPITTFL